MIPHTLHLRRLERDLSSQNAILLTQAAAELARAAALLPLTPDGSHIPGFLEPVRPWTAEKIAGASHLAFDRDLLTGRAEVCASARIHAAAVDIRSRPTIVLSAIHGGPRARTMALGIRGDANVIPEPRLVADQTTDRVLATLGAFFDAEGLEGIGFEVLRRGEPAARSTTGPFGRLVSDVSSSTRLGPSAGRSLWLTPAADRDTGAWRRAGHTDRQDRDRTP